MEKSIALLFAGQGAQQVGMGKDLSQQFAVAANRFAIAALTTDASHQDGTATEDELSLGLAILDQAITDATGQL